jgi:D-ribulokinase
VTDNVTEPGAVWLGLDLGTQSVRAIAVSATGDVLGVGFQRLTSQRDGPRHEQNPEEWWRAVAAASHTAVVGVPPGSIRGVAVDGTSGTILLTDRSGRPLTLGLMYDDTRAVEEARRVNEVGAAVWTSLGYRMQPSWALPKLLWLLREYPDLLPGARLTHQVDFINRRLVGREVSTDSSTALKTGYELVHVTWPHEILAALGVPEEIMPGVVRPGTQIGTVTTEAAAMTGIPQGTPVIAGMTDGCAAQVGAGALSVGSWNSVLGTTLVLKGVTQELIRDPLGVVYSHRSPVGGWLPGGASSTGAGVLTACFPGRDLDALSEQAAAWEPASVIAYPLVSRGERFPFTAPEAEGFVLGEPTDEIDLYAAMLQGVAFIERLCFDYLDMLGAPTNGDLRLTGGGARSRYWSQIRADILGRQVSIPENAEAALGMAVLAASVGRRVSEVASEMVRVREVIDPRPDRSERFREPYIKLIDEFEHRGWVQAGVAEQARRRIGQ